MSSSVLVGLFLKGQHIPGGSRAASDEGCVMRKRRYGGAGSYAPPWRGRSGEHAERGEMQEAGQKREHNREKADVAQWPQMAEEDGGARRTPLMQRGGDLAPQRMRKEGGRGSLLWPIGDVLVAAAEEQVTVALKARASSAAVSMSAACSADEM